MSDSVFENMYPDVLGAISGGARVDLDAVQCALGIFPEQAYINQPVEAVLLLQNMIDQPLQLKVSVNLPSQDKKGNAMVMDTGQPVIAVDMGPGEVGVLRIPIIAYPPTQPAAGIPVHVAVRFRGARTGHPVRLRAGGPPPSGVLVSPFKLQVLKDVKFGTEVWQDSPDIMTAYFDIAPKRLPPTQYSLTSRYETLWTDREIAVERQLMQGKASEARRVSSAMTTSTIYLPLRYAVEQNFGARGIPLHVGEAKAIAKTLAYTLAEATIHERSFTLANSRWFRALCYALVHDPTIADWSPGDVAAQHLLEAAVYDGVVVGFSVLQPRIKENLGDQEERLNYADTVAAWYAGNGDPDLNFVYLPLVMAGVALNLLVAVTAENPWIMLNELREAFAVRRRESDALVFELLDQLLTAAEADLRRMNYQQP